MVTQNFVRTERTHFGVTTGFRIKLNCRLTRLCRWWFLGPVYHLKLVSNPFRRPLGVQILQVSFQAGGCSTLRMSNGNNFKDWTSVINLSHGTVSSHFYRWDKGLEGLVELLKSSVSRQVCCIQFIWRWRWNVQRGSSSSTFVAGFPAQNSSHRCTSSLLRTLFVGLVNWHKQ